MSEFATQQIDALNAFEDTLKRICESNLPYDSAENSFKVELDKFASIWRSKATFSFAFVRSEATSLVRVQSDIKISIDCRKCLIEISHDSIRWGFNPFFYFRIGTLIVLLAMLMSYDESIQASFIADPSDGIAPVTAWNGSAYAYPSLAYSSFRPDSCLIVDPYFVRSGGYAELREASLSSLPPWSERSNVAVWRGSAHGHRLYRSSNITLSPEWAWHQRLHLCAISKIQELAPLLDVGIINYDSLPVGALRNKIDGLGFKRAGILKSTFAWFKYIVDVDGFSNSWPGLFSALLTGSCVLKIKSALGFRQWYYDRLVPWKNFVPVSATLEDLPERLEWVRSHDEEAREIGEAGPRLALSMSFEAETHHSVIDISRWLKIQIGVAERNATPGERVPEPYKTSGAVTIEETVIKACYRKLLLRDPDADGLEGGIQRLRNIGLTHGIEAVISGIVECREFEENWTRRKRE